MKEETKVKNRNEKDVELYKKLFTNIVIAIIIMLYFIFVNLGSINIDHDIFLTDIKVFSIIILGIAIIIFEKAYKKDSNDLALYGVEILVLACHTLSINHITNIFKFDFKYYILTSAYFFAIYYVFKDILIYTKENKKRLESLSDISDIVKKEKPSKKEAKKKVKVEEDITLEDSAKNEKESNDKGETKKQTNKKEEKEKTKVTKKKTDKSNSKKETKVNKAAKTTKASKKEDTPKKEKIEKETKKKTNTTKKQKIVEENKEEENKEEENKPKKRGRPKKKVE